MAGFHVCLLGLEKACGKDKYLLDHARRSYVSMFINDQRRKWRHLNGDGVRQELAKKCLIKIHVRNILLGFTA